MLQLLVRYAQTHGLVTEAGFAPKTVKWSLVFDPEGRFLQVVGLGDTSQKKNRGHTFPRCPELSQPEMIRAGSGCRHFLVDSADVVALHADEPDAPKLQAKHAYFVRLLEQAASAVPDLSILARSLNDRHTLVAVCEQLRANRAKPTDKVTFSVLGRQPPFIVESEAWHDWWRGFRGRLAAGAESRSGVGHEVTEGCVPCLASGELVRPARTHLKIVGLSDVGGLATGDALASFDKESFRSYGLEQSANAPVSEEMAATYRAALNDLIRNHGQRLTGAKVVHWFKGRIPDDENPLKWLIELDSNEEAVAQHRAANLLSTLRTGERPDLVSNVFYALTLSGAAGRVMVRDWMEGSFEELVRNVKAWFDDMSIVARDGRGGLAPPPKFLAVLGATVRELKHLSPALEARLWRVAVRRERIPFEVLVRTLGRVKLDVITNQTFNHARMGLLRAFHVRQGDADMQPFLNEQHPDPAYHCGRVMAILADLQHRALGDVGAGVVQRYYAAASVTPALVLGRLARTAQFHLNKLDKGLAHWYDGRLGDVWGKIRDRLPRTLSIEEQSLFALGYYHQLASNRQRAFRPSMPVSATPGLEREEKTNG